jgi:hypothetical protein
MAGKDRPWLLGREEGRSGKKGGTAKKGDGRRGD